MNVRLLHPLILITLAVPLRAATVAFIPGPIPFPVFFSPTGSPVDSGFGHFRIGYFLNFSDTPEFRANLSGDEDASIHAFLERNFIPLGEPIAEVFAFLGGNPPLGLSHNLSQSPIPSGANGLGVRGSVTGSSLVFTNSAPNTFDPGGLPRGSRIFMLCYTELAFPSGHGPLAIVSATNWLIPQPLSTIATFPVGSVDTEEEVFRGRLETQSGSPKIFGYFSPEPGSTTLGIAAAMMLAGCRRRTA